MTPRGYVFVFKIQVWEEFPKTILFVTHDVEEAIKAANIGA